MNSFNSMRCRCSLDAHAPKLVVLTGGPGAGKTAVLEMARRHFCPHVAILPEAASIIFGGGFIRRETLPAKKAAQRAIFHVQRELERIVVEEKKYGIVLCDRGTLDGLAYWPNSEESFWKETGTNRKDEFARYAAVIHLKTPNATDGYNHDNPVRLETASEAAKIDERIAMAWAGHPHQHAVESSHEFVDKAALALELIRSELPVCCQRDVKIPKKP